MMNVPLLAADLRQHWSGWLAGAAQRLADLIFQGQQSVDDIAFVEASLYAWVFVIPILVFVSVLGTSGMTRVPGRLQNVLEWAVITVGKGTVHPWHLPKTFGVSPEAFQQPGSGAPPHHETGRTLDEVEMDYILATLKATNNDRKKAAHMLGISLRTLYNRLAQASGAEKAGSAQTRAAGSEVS